MCLDGTAGSNLLVDWALANVVRAGDSVTLAHAEAGADTEQPPLFVENILDNCIEVRARSRNDREQAWFSFGHFFKRSPGRFRSRLTA